jgi:hypothetical protein
MFTDDFASGKHHQSSSRLGFGARKGRAEARLNTIAALSGSFDKSISELLKGL